MNTEELSNRLTQILTGITSGEPNLNIIPRLCPELYRRLQTRLLLRNLSHRRRRLYSYLYRILYLGRRRGWSYTWYKTFQRLQYIP